ncbi:MAG TPA: polyphenol oxidase family protein [Solirubrobacteraceae bacterium]|nr:polyphenol oxidase family protein [Solirubrobacteraceae bacterium]
MELPEPFYLSGEHLAVDLPGARALFTTRRGGVSTGPYASLNLGKLTADDPEAVQRNRDRLQARLDARMAMIRQVHGSRVLRRDDPSQASGAAPAGDLEEADGQATALRGLAPMVMTADCLPIAIAGGGAVAMLHAGWRGLAEGVIETGVHALRELAPGATLTAAIGPGASVCCYEVGDEVRRRFADYGASVTRGRNLDLKAIARAQLKDGGVEEVHDVGLCTICSPPALFFSHRRDGGVTGRQAGIAWLI